MQRRLFQIGFPGCGTTAIAALLTRNGIPVARWLEGALAEDIAHARLTGDVPLARWPDIRAFADMESARFLNMPVVQGFRDHALLDAHHPGAVFVLNTRRIKDWITDRYLHRDGAHARSIAAHLGVAPGDLADLWARDWQDHIAAVHAHFGDRRDLVHIDMDHASLADCRDALAPWFDLPHLPDAAGRILSRPGQAERARVAAMRAEPMPGADIDPDRRVRLSRRLSRLAAPARQRQKGSIERPPHQQAVCLDLDTGTLRSADGTRLPLVRGPGGRFHLEPGRPGLLRAAAICNDIAVLARDGRYWLDPRATTAAPQIAAEGPVITTLRRKGARNAVLWPGPWLHRIGNAGFPGRPDVAGPAWQDRADLIFWRGTLSGTAPGDPRTAEAMITALAAGPDPAAATHLPRSGRWRILAAHAGRAGLDLGLRPDARVAAALDRAGLTPPVPFAGPPPPARFALCLEGSEGDADLLPLVQTDAVVLAEGREWESCITGLFQPWKHLIPLAPGATDLSERLDWARRNPVECRRIVQRARRLCHDLADPSGRRLHLGRVLADYRRATGQD